MNVNAYVSRWLSWFWDEQTGLFYERLDRQGQPIRTGRRRLLTQCRQMVTYADAVQAGADLPIDFKAVLTRIESAYQTRTPGRWVLTCDDNGAVLDACADFYAHAFVILMYAALGRLRDHGDLRNHAAQQAHKTLAFLKDTCAHPAGGFIEGINADGTPFAGMRRQNPHMHLFEATLHAYETWGDPVWACAADDLLSLFLQVFYDPHTHTVCEFFDDDWSPHPVHGTRVEPGHVAEWIWLLGRYAGLFGDRDDLRTARAGLWDLMDAYGFQGVQGALVDAIDTKGAVHEATARIWPQLEGVKACRQMKKDAVRSDRAAMRSHALWAIINRGYLRADGSWIEWRDAQGHVAQDEQPGTTPYHIWFAIKER